MESQASHNSSKPQSPLPSSTPTPTLPLSAAPKANVLTVPVAVSAQEGTYVYIAIKSSLYGEDCSIFGLNEDEYRAIITRFNCSSTPIHNGILIKAPALTLINALSQLGYKVICSTGEAEIVWTMQREI